MPMTTKKYQSIAQEFCSPMIHGVAYITAATDQRIGRWVGKRPGEIVAIFRDRRLQFYVFENDWRRLGVALLKRLTPAYYAQIERHSYQTIAAHLRYARQLKSQNCQRLSNQQLVARYRRLYSLWQQASRWGHLVNLTDFEHFELSKRIEEIIRRRIGSYRSSADSAEVTTALLTPLGPTTLALQDRAFLQLLIDIQADARLRLLFRRPLPTVIQRLTAYRAFAAKLTRHVNRFDWLQYHYDGPIILDRRYFIELLHTAVQQNVDAAGALARLRHEQIQQRQAQRRWLKALKFSRDEMFWIYVGRSAMFLKALRKDAVFESSRCADGLLGEIARRLALSSVQCRHVTIDELEQGLSRGHLDVDMINRRIGHSAWRAVNGTVTILAGDAVRDITRRVAASRRQAPKVQTLKGMSAYPGRVSGRVKLVFARADMAKVKPGDIMVSPATNPDVVPAMKIAGAIVTNEGGVTCHAAIVSRELKIPCIIGTKIATRVFKDGDRVEVDATNGIVKKL